MISPYLLRKERQDDMREQTQAATPREEIQMSHLRVTLSSARTGKGYRLSRPQMRIPTQGGDDSWVRISSRCLPDGTLSGKEVRTCLQQQHARAQRLYQAQKQQHAEVRAQWRRWQHRHEEPQLEVRTEYTRGAERSWIVD